MKISSISIAEIKRGKRVGMDNKEIKALLLSNHSKEEVEEVFKRYYKSKIITFSAMILLIAALSILGSQGYLPGTETIGYVVHAATVNPSSLFSAMLILLSLAVIVGMIAVRLRRKG